MKILLLSLLLAFGQNAADPKPKGSLEGWVQGPAGQPIPGAAVQLLYDPIPAAGYRPDMLPSSTTDINGRFRIENIEPFGYQVIVRATGYVEQRYGAAPGPGKGTAVRVHANETTQGITVRLTRDNIISGRVTLVTGEPLLRMQVSAVRRVFDETGWPTLRSVASAETNDRGEYRIAGVPEGRYYVRATPPIKSLIDSEDRRAQSLRQPIPPKPTPGLYAPMFYPYSPVLATALAIDVKAGVETRNIDIAMAPGRDFTVSGRVSDPEAPYAEAHIAMLYPANQPFPASLQSATVAKDGTFNIANVPPGSYWVMARVDRRYTREQSELAMSPGTTRDQLPPLPPTGAALVKVVDSDISNVQITILRDTLIDGQITAENGPASVDAVTVAFHRFDTVGGLDATPSGIFLRGNNGKFQYTNLTPGEFWLTVSNVPPGFYVKEGKFGDLDVLNRAFAFTSKLSSPLSIVLARGGIVGGTVTDAAGLPVAAQQVVLVPDRPTDRKDFYKTATTAANGSFTILGVAPGDYRVFAWSTMPERYGYFDPDFVKPFQDRSARVGVSETTSASVEVKVIP